MTPDRLLRFEQEARATSALNHANILWRVPLYGVLWMLVDAIVEHRLGRRAETALEAAMSYVANKAR